MDRSDVERAHTWVQAVIQQINQELAIRRAGTTTLVLFRDSALYAMTTQELEDHLAAAHTEVLRLRQLDMSFSQKEQAERSALIRRWREEKRE